VSLRCAIYARFSSDAHGYSDEAVTGSAMERKGLQTLLAAATGGVRRFDCILIDDSSRLTS
jgi:hypothetical protein